MRPARHIVTTAAALLSTAAVAHAAPSVSVEKPCYSEGQEMVLSGQGFDPSSELSLDLTLTTQQSGAHRTETFPESSDASGVFDASFTTPSLMADQDDTEQIDITVSDAQHHAASASSKLSIIDAYVAPWESHKANPRKKATFEGWGFGTVGGKKLYAHYVRKGKLRKTVAVGTLTGPCGNISKRMRQFPFRPVKAGTYRIDLDATKKWPNNSPGYTYSKVKVSKKRAVR
jgi:hypothetical protein